MKICLINNLYPPTVRGGAEQVVARTVERLLAEGHSVVVITTSAGAGSEEHKERLSIYRFCPTNLYYYTNATHHSVVVRGWWHLVNLFHVGSARHIANILLKEKPDIVHTHNLMGVGFLVPYQIRRLGFRHVHTVHDVQLVEPSGVILKLQERSWRYTKFPFTIYAWVMRRLIGSPDIVISPSQFLLDFYTTRGFFPASQKVLLRNPVPLPTTIDRFRPDTALHFLYLGQIEAHKGVLFLVDAFMEFLRTSSVLATLHMVGAGSQQALIEKKVQGISRFVLHGKVERGMLPQLFARIDATIVPSLCYENSPTVIFESFSFGVPVIASRVEGIAEIIKEGENGWTFETGNRQALVEVLHAASRRPTVLQEMGKKSIQYVKPLSEEKYSLALLQLYHRLVRL